MPGDVGVAIVEGDRHAPPLARFHHRGKRDNLCAVGEDLEVFHEAVGMDAQLVGVARGVHYPVVHKDECAQGRRGSAGTRPLV